MKKILSLLMVWLMISGFCEDVFALSPPYVDNVEIIGQDVIYMPVGGKITLKAKAKTVGVDFAYMLWTSSGDSNTVKVIGNDGTMKFEPSVSEVVIKAYRPGTAVVSVCADVSGIAENGDYYECDSVKINVFGRSLGAQRAQGGVYDLDGTRQSFLETYISPLEVCDAEYIGISRSFEDSANIEIPENVLAILDDGEYFAMMDIRSLNDENPYPVIRSTDVRVRVPLSSGNVGYIGKDYRLFFAENKNAELMDVSDSIQKSDLSNITFDMEKLGVYVLCFNPHIFNVEFCSDEPIFDEEYNQINPECIVFERIQNLKDGDKVIFPEIPQKEGFVFTGWKCRPYSSGGSGNRQVTVFTEPQPVKAGRYMEEQYYASWCPVDEYEPIKIEISSEEPLIKGREDGKKIILKSNYGVFADEERWYNDWIFDYEEETDEDAKAEILSWHREEWSVVGSDEIIVKSAKRIDDKTVELTLMGNSSDIYDKSEFQIEFDGYFLMPEGYEAENEISNGECEKIKMDSDGVRAKMYCSDNSIELKKQSRTGGSGGSVTYTVVFDTYGGSTIENQSVRKGNRALIPQTPEKVGYTFDGWYLDKECTKEYDFSTSVLNSLNLYAKWSEEKIDEKNQIIMTVGEKTFEAFGEAKEMDVAPILKNEKTFVPIRVVAESIGAEVIWTEEEAEKVVIRKDGVEIILNIGSDKAVINTEEITLDSITFLEQDRTFVPLRFIFEALGTDVVWDNEKQQVVVTKK